MKLLSGMGYLVLTIASLAYPQSQDSLLFDQLNKGIKTNDDVFLLMYVQGRISHSDLFISSQQYRNRFFETRIALITNLREQLRNKSVLDYLVRASDTTYRQEMIPPSEDVPGDFRVIDPGDPRADEAFVLLGKGYRLYRCPSFDGKEDYRLLATGSPESIERFDLFAASDSVPARLDSFVVTRQGGGCTFGFDTINGGNILRVEDTSWGDGHREINMQILAARNGRFTDVFRCTVAALVTQGVATTHRLVRQIAYEDKNDDGFLDIIETVTDDVVDAGVATPGDVMHFKADSHVSRQQYSHLWNNAALRFEQVQ